MPDARTRVIALCRLGFVAQAYWAWLQPPAPPHPHAEAQLVIDRCLDRSRQHCGSLEDFLETVFEDGLVVGWMHAGVRYERDAPVGLERLDPRLDRWSVEIIRTAPVRHWDYTVKVWREFAAGNRGRRR